MGGQSLGRALAERDQCSPVYRLGVFARLIVIRKSSVL